MDILTFIHLFIYPCVATGLAFSCLFLFYIDRYLLALVTWCLTIGMAILSIEAHMNYQGYLLS